jgi:VCBS repeat-containing protein
VDGDTLTYGIVGGEAGEPGLVVKVGTYGTLTLNTGTGYYNYAKFTAAIEALDDDETGVDAFTFSVTDGDDDLVTREWQVTVTGADDAPTLAAVTAGTIAEVLDSSNTIDTILSGTLSGADVDGDSLTYGIDGGEAQEDGTVTKVGTYGTLVVDTASGAWEYIKDTDAINTLQSPNTDTDSFTMTVSDGDGVAVTRPWSVTPFASAPSLSTGRSRPVRLRRTAGRPS